MKCADGSRTQTTVEDESLTSLNRNFISGLIGLGDAEIQIRTIIKPRLETESRRSDKADGEDTISEHNLTVYQRFWDFITSERKLKNPSSTRNDILAALKAIEPLSLVTATREELKRRVNEQPDKRARRYAIRINQLLDFLGRSFSLPLRKAEQDDVHYISWEELQQVLPELPTDQSRILAQVLFCTGVRVGEAFQLPKRTKKANNSIFVEKQLTRKFEVRGLKNGKPHETLLLAQGNAAYSEWCALTEVERRNLRNTISHHLLQASRRVFPDEARHISSHDLRHSYAIYLLERRATVTEIASMLGDTEATVRKHYTGWIANSRMIDNINALLFL